MSLVRTHMEQAGFYAQKTLASRRDNQEPDGRLSLCFSDELEARAFGLLHDPPLIPTKAECTHNGEEYWFVDEWVDQPLLPMPSGAKSPDLTQMSNEEVRKHREWLAKQPVNHEWAEKQEDVDLRFTAMLKKLILEKAAQERAAKPEVSEAAPAS